MRGIFTAGFKISERSDTVTAKIQVIEKAQICLLSRETAVKLGPLHIGHIDYVNATQSNANGDFTVEIQDKYKKCFQRGGKLKIFSLVCMLIILSSQGPSVFAEYRSV